MNTLGYEPHGQTQHLHQRIMPLQIHWAMMLQGINYTLNLFLMLISPGLLKTKKQQHVPINAKVLD